MKVSDNEDFSDDELLDEEDEDTQKNLFLTFRLGGEDYGIEIRHVIEINSVQKITEVPDMPAFVKGVINLRGQVIPVTDLRLRFHLEPRPYDDRTCVIVVRIEDTNVGLIVDRVCEVQSIPEEDLAPPPTLGQEGRNRYVLGLGKVGSEVKILLDVKKMLFAGEADHLVAASA
jgi:purine-binding chemotaxis protein CheW